MNFNKLILYANQQIPKIIRIIIIILYHGFNINNEEIIIPGEAIKLPPNQTRTLFIKLLLTVETSVLHFLEFDIEPATLANKPTKTNPSAKVI